MYRDREHEQERKRIGLAKGRKLLRHAFWVLPTTRQMDPLAKV